MIRESHNHFAVKTWETFPVLKVIVLLFYHSKSIINVITHFLLRWASFPFVSLTVWQSYKICVCDVIATPCVRALLFLSWGGFSKWVCLSACLSDWLTVCLSVTLSLCPSHFFYIFVKFTFVHLSEAYLTLGSCFHKKIHFGRLTHQIPFTSLSSP